MKKALFKFSNEEGSKFNKNYVFFIINSHIHKNMKKVL
jgi:hypothetical protein